jgi:hypothetical protein
VGARPPLGREDAPDVCETLPIHVAGLQLGFVILAREDSGQNEPRRAWQSSRTDHPRHRSPRRRMASTRPRIPTTQPQRGSVSCFRQRTTAARASKGIPVHGRQRHGTAVGGSSGAHAEEPLIRGIAIAARARATARLEPHPVSRTAALGQGRPMSPSGRAPRRPARRRAIRVPAAARPRG